MNHPEPAKIEIDEKELLQQLNYIKELLKDKKVNLEKEQIEKLYSFTEILMTYNRVLNLTAIKDIKGICLKHYYDSVLPLGELEFPQNAKIVDVGTGAGFPAIPLKISRNDLSFTLLDSSKKRLDFIDKVCKAIGLDSMKTLHSRAEDAGVSKEYREKYDICVSRAVSQLNVLCEYCLPLVKVGGYFYAYKGSKGSEELESAKNAIKILGGEYTKTVYFDLPEENGQREIIIIKKVSSTNSKYPRKGTKISSKPL